MQLYSIVFERGASPPLSIALGLCSLVLAFVSQAHTKRSFWICQLLAWLALLIGVIGHVAGRHEISHLIQEVIEGTSSGDNPVLGIFGSIQSGAVYDPLYVGIVCWITPMTALSLICWKRSTRDAHLRTEG